MNDDRQRALLETLARDGVIHGSQARLTPLTGGVSSEIYRLDDDGRAFVVKRALPKLAVEAEWYANVSRNRHEAEYLTYVGGFLPEAVPKVHAVGDGYFVMDCFTAEYRNWKTLLLRGECLAEHARQAAGILATIHCKSAGDIRLRSQFDTLHLFRELRIDPYLRTAAERNTSVAAQLESEAIRLGTWRECLVHGDFSPKNILTGPKRMIVLDCEVACYGDPAFDVAFLFNHFCLKALHLHPTHHALQALLDAAWHSYQTARPQSGESLADFECRIGRLLPMLMLARVDGKSPAEYLIHQQQHAMIRRFAHDQIGRGPRPLPAVCSDWFLSLDLLRV
jgi:aminoglycoside phosphotransferase (APT) family kinase protein